MRNNKLIFLHYSKTPIQIIALTESGQSPDAMRTFYLLSMPKVSDH